ncbi:hypothetical protein ACX8Z9_03975 [Arthrobacter halodurans]|uniref:DUF998 domain-containing protein n=1 Tax=Arthrobacter halodurans TaxID=516699 RepID=A0ABV4UN72_9MICC
MAQWQQGGTPGPPTHAVEIESRSIWAAVLAGAAALAVGLIAFRGYRPPLAGDGSVAIHASVVCGATAGLAFVAGYVRNVRTVHVWWGSRPMLRQVVDVAALLVVHSSIAVMSSLVLFRLFQQAFFGLTVDAVAGATMLAVASGVAGYFAYTSGARITAATLSVLLAVFMASGMLVSMLFAENPLWWHSMFSELGTGQAGLTSFWTFNTTITTSGVILTTLSAFITRDLRRWAVALDARDERDGRRRRRFLRPRPGVVRACLIAGGVCMAGIGVFPVNSFEPVHTGFVRLLALILAVLLLGVPLWLPGFPGAFYLLSLIAVASLAGAAVLWRPLQYYNLTALELGAAGIVFGWLVVFIRTTAAVVEAAGVGHALPGEPAEGDEAGAAGAAGAVPGRAPESRLVDDGGAADRHAARP